MDIRTCNHHYRERLSKIVNNSFILGFLVLVFSTFLGCSEQSPSNNLDDNIDDVDLLETRLEMNLWSASLSLEIGTYDASLLNDCYEIVEIYTNGYCVDKDPQKAKLWRDIGSSAYNTILSSARSGDREAQFELAEYYWGDDDCALPNRKRNNAKLAIYWYSKAAENGYLPAMSILGFIYDVGREFYRDFGSAGGYAKGTQDWYLDYFDAEYWKTIPAASESLSTFWRTKYENGLNALKKNAIDGDSNAKRELYLLWYSEKIFLNEADALLVAKWSSYIN